MNRSKAGAVTSALADRSSHLASQAASDRGETGTRDRECATYRLHIVALDVADAVTHAGG